MDKVQKIRKEVQRLMNELIQEKEKGYGSDIDDACILELQNVLTFINSLQEEPVSEDLQKASEEWLTKQLDKSYAKYGERKMMELSHFDGYSMLDAIEFGAQWQKEHLLKPADSDDLPDIDREVIVLYQRYPMENNEYAVGFAHRPKEYWDGRNIETDEVTRYYPKRYDKGGWNSPNIKYWLDCELPKVEEE